MPITNGSPIIATDVNGIWQTALGTLRSNTSDNAPWKQYTETFVFNGLSTATSPVIPVHNLSTIYVPRTDVILRAARLYISAFQSGSLYNGATATLTIPAQIIENNTIVGGNIKNTLTCTATSTNTSTLSSGAGLITLPNTETFSFLAGDNIDIVVSIDSALPTTVLCYITVSLTFENILTG
jgi:hypothetical protein